MKNAPFFSVIMPVYNGELYVAHAIESVLGQTSRDWEFIIVDDCSTDRTPTILAEYAAKDSRIIVMRNEDKSKVSQSLNRGIAKASGRWMAHLDADDFFDIDYLEKLELYAHKAVGDYFCSSWVNVVDEFGGKILDIELPKAEKIQRMIKIENFLYHSATSFPKALWEKVGGYPEEVTLAEDVALWIRFSEAGAKLIMIPQFLVSYRIHYSNLTSVQDAKLFATEMDSAAWKSVRQNREWRASLYLKQLKLKRARAEILEIGRRQKFLSFKNLQYFVLTFLPQSLVYFTMWELRPRLRALLKSMNLRNI